MSKKFNTFLLVALLSVYSCFTLFVFTTIFVEIFSRIFLIIMVSLFLTIAHLVMFKIMKNEHPLVFLICFPIEVLIVCSIANIDNSFLIKSLEFYGIYSTFTTVKDPVLTAAPFYVDALLFASLTLSAREAVFVPIYYYNKSKNTKAK